MTLDFQANKEILKQVATIPSKRLRNKIAGYCTRLKKKMIRDNNTKILLQREEEARPLEKRLQDEKAALLRRYNNMTEEEKIVDEWNEDEDDEWNEDEDDESNEDKDDERNEDEDERKICSAYDLLVMAEEPDRVQLEVEWDTYKLLSSLGMTSNIPRIAVAPMKKPPRAHGGM